jgi:hypothetical protein
MQAHPDRPRSRRSWIGQLYTFDSIQAARRFDDDGFHDDLQFKREATDSFARLENLVRTARPSARVHAVSIGAVAHAPGRKTGEEREPWLNRGAVGEQHTF